MERVILILRQTLENSEIVFHIQKDTLFMVKSIIAIIPARGGSKGIPQKNIKMLGDKPLIAYTIEESLKSKYLDHVFVSTEDPEIGEISKTFGSEVIERPTALSEDTSKSVDAILHAIEYLEKKNIQTQIVVLLQPTSPLRNTEDIDAAIKLFLDNECDSVISVCEPDHSPFWCFTFNGEYLQPLFNEKYDNKRRQDLPRVFMPNGAIYVSSPESIRRLTGFIGNKVIPYCMPPERSIDIDTPLDFTIAEVLINK
ncbi:acylneuraminate cytidylyltransferase family protein [Methanogenium sp. S4BF]|uniref:acylneuraminate cytidylyltransferase family protein n=1 Tax=Methanogenium sp. S4BF TaxID=1789226 RepID=UPI002417CDC2|nr:acylneuraminate cytidylyltransferase family protein [Methanogenium sp. S4BF]WFN35003.1 acylneuraminate cytidylyltransferase family protein [Methanogenium sp. S4BF]